MQTKENIGVAVHNGFLIIQQRVDLIGWRGHHYNQEQGKDSKTRLYLPWFCHEVRPVAAEASKNFRHKPLRYLFRCFLDLMATGLGEFHNQFKTI